MKKILFFLLLFTHIIFGSVKQINIGKHLFTMITHSYDVEDTKGKYFKLFQGSTVEDVKPILRFTLKDETGACSAKSLINGSYEVKNKQLFLYTAWNRKGKAYLAPYGFRIQIYEVTSTGKLKLVSSQIYLEATKYKQDDDSGMQYLFKSPKTKEEEKSLKLYIEEVEKNYNAVFVFGEAKNDLKTKVKKAIFQNAKVGWGKK